MNDPLSLTRDTFDPFQIGTQLSRIARYAGLGNFALSVAQHCVILTEFVPPELKLAALTHDVGECFIGDVPVAAKRKAPQIKEYEDQILARIGELIGVTPEQYEAVLPYDVTIREDEMLALGLKRFQTRPMLGANIVPWTEDYARKEWIGMFILYTYDRREQ